MAEDSQAEFVRLLSQNASQLYGFVLVLTGNRSDTEDIIQDTSVVLWKKFGTYQSGTNFLAWARRIAYLQTLSARRKSSRMKTLSDDAWKILASDALAISDEVVDRQSALDECLQKLVAADRKLLEQKYFSQLSVAEIATVQSRANSSIYRALSRIHYQLSQCVQQTLARR
jgi:RNA polymerase sigma-70 factor (ECF subfamily)